MGVLILIVMITKNFPKKSRELTETCFKHEDCKSKRCFDDDRRPAPFYHASDNYITTCLPKKGDKKQYQKFVDLLKKKRQKVNFIEKKL